MAQAHTDPAPSSLWRLVLTVVLLVVSVGLLAPRGVRAAARSGREATTVLVSRAGKKGPGGDGNSFEPSVSANGRYVAFASRAGNLTAKGRGRESHRARKKSGPHRLEIYVRDLKKGTTVLVSRAAGGAGLAANGASSQPSISGDGRRVAFKSEATNLGAGLKSPQIFVRDLDSATTTLVSRGDGPNGAIGDAYSEEPDISADGRHVVFLSESKNLLTDPTAIEQVFVRDLDAAHTEAIAVARAGDEGSSPPSISADGSRVAFTTSSALDPADPARTEPGASQTDVYVRDRASGTNIFVSRGAGPDGQSSLQAGAADPVISDDGMHVVFESDAEYVPGHTFLSLYMRDLGSGELSWIGESNSVGGTGGPAAISADGRYVAFSSLSRGLTAVDAPNRGDVLVRDTKTGLVIDAARASGNLGLPADTPTVGAAISSDGNAIAFGGRATNLSDADADRFGDVFLRRPVYQKEVALPKCDGRTATRIGTDGADVLRGTAGADVILGLGGHDRISAFGGADVVCGGPGGDTIDLGKVYTDRYSGGEMDIAFGEGGADRISGGDGPTLIRAGAGADSVQGSGQADRIFGEGGPDILRGEGSTQNDDEIFGGPGNDKLFGRSPDDRLVGGPGHDLITGPARGP